MVKPYLGTGEGPSEPLPRYDTFLKKLAPKICILENRSLWVSKVVIQTSFLVLKTTTIKVELFSEAK